MSREVNEEFESTFNNLLKLAENLANSKNQSGKKEKKNLQDFIATINNPEILQEAINKLNNPQGFLIDSNQIVSVMTVIKDIKPFVIEMLVKKSQEMSLRRPAGSRQSVKLSTEVWSVDAEAWIVTKTKVIYKATNSNDQGVLSDYVLADSEIKRFVGSITDMSQLERMLEDLEDSKKINQTPEYAKSVDYVITNTIIPRKNILAENKENLESVAQEPKSSRIDKVTDHRSKFGSLRRLFQTSKSAEVRNTVIDATLLAVTDADEDLSEIDAEDLDSGKVSLELVGLEVEATGLKKLIQDFKAKNPERKAAAINRLNNLVESVRKLLAKPSVKEQFVSLAVKLSNAKDGSKMQEKFRAQLDKLINSASREELLEAIRQFDNLKFRANPISGVQNNANFNLVAENIDKKINDKLDGKVSEPELRTQSPRGSINLDELEEPDFPSEKLRNSGTFSDEEFSASYDDPTKKPKRFDVFLKLQGLTARFKRTEKEVKNIQGDEQAEIDRIQRELDKSLNDDERTFIFVGDVMDPDNLLDNQILAQGLNENVNAANSLEETIKSQPSLNTKRFANFKKIVSDVSARVSEKLFPFQKTLEKLANQYAVADTDKKKVRIENKIDRLIESKNDQWQISRVLRNLEKKNDEIYQIVIDKLDARCQKLEANELNSSYSLPLVDFMTNDDESLVDVDMLDSQEISVPNYVRTGARNARLASENDKKDDETPVDDHRHDI